MGRDIEKMKDKHGSSSKKNKKDKKEKKEKHKKKDKKQKKEGQKQKQQKKNQWGKYGTISNTDMYLKREEFLMWLSDVKMLNIEAITPQEEKKFFEEYVECYNTATFPSKKFYNFKFWFEKEQLKEHLQQAEIEMLTFDDEKEKQKEQQEQKELIKKQKLQREYQHLHEFQNIAQDMQKQKQLQELLRHYLQMGNHEAAVKIQKQLNPIHTIDMNQIQQQPPIDFDYDYDNF
ncbi:unnamed protein product [Paramecium primaurelia]|uniref:Uncharacterized protein n=2 Tax=Paramecium TaxID=5884 RepID=A0A8S1W7E0_9CILI|nr:unnamed protein product [Paramecium primaurelia]CAD8185180.1 unnamed protein product [Paramecium pentaurelia]